MLPLLSDEGNENWLLLAPSAYVAVNAAVNEEKQEAAKRVLELISTSEGQEAVMKDLQMGVSYCIITSRIPHLSLRGWKNIFSQAISITFNFLTES